MGSDHQEIPEQDPWAACHGQGAPARAGHGLHHLAAWRPRLSPWTPLSPVFAVAFPLPGGASPRGRVPLQPETPRPWSKTRTKLRGARFLRRHRVSALM